MRRFLSARLSNLIGITLLLLMALTFGAPTLRAQETTGALDGTVKDASGAVVANAHVVLTSPSLVGQKSIDTDAKGYYHFSNLPPGTYTETVTAAGFNTQNHTGLQILVGHLPTVDVAMTVGNVSETVQVTTEGPQIDVTSTNVQTNLTQDVVDNIPHGLSFQSAIEFAPAARNEPLLGMTPSATGNGNGGSSPGSTSSGSANGYTIAGGSDSENAYLVEGQETANLIGGYSRTNVPFEFIKEMVMDTSGVQAQYGGALGGVINVIMNKGSNNVHGALWLQFSSAAMNGSPLPYSRYSPTGVFSPTTDVTWQQYQEKKHHATTIIPGFRIGLPLMKDKLWLEAQFQPQLETDEVKINYDQTGGIGGGVIPFSRNTQTYYTNLRLDAALTQKIRVFGSLLDQGQRQSGTQFPRADDVNGLFNVVSSISPTAYPHAFGYSAPNSTYNLGLDAAVSSAVVLTTRFGYFFENYHDLGYPQDVDNYIWQASGIGATAIGGGPGSLGPLQQGSGFITQGNDQNFTLYNADKRIMLDQDVSIYKSGLAGTHNIRFGYQLNRSQNNLFQRWNSPTVLLYPGSTQFYYAAGSTGYANCAALVASHGGNTAYGDPAGSNCTGTDGYVVIQDYGSKGEATSYDHAFYGQDSWTLGKGVTINYGLRVENEYLPSENTPAGFPSKPIQFGWNDKVSPRVGFAWDPMQNGKSKLFGSYGVFNDTMKLNLAIGSFGGQYWQNCAYALNSNTYTDVNIAFDANDRYCTGDSTGGANFAAGSAPSDVTFLENVNNRGTEGVTPGLKPYRQHDTTLGYDYQVLPTVSFEVRWDRRRLDHVIEDAALFNSAGSEVFTIVNPGEGANATNTTCDSTGLGFAECPPNVKAARAYDGIEFRFSKRMSNHWSGLFSYTYSNFRGNYCGLTSCDLSDGGGGRNAPNNSRAFDETYFQFNAYGGSSSGKLPTDRPNALKGYAYYEIPEGTKNKTVIGIFQDAYQGTPAASYVDVGYSVAGGGNGGEFAVYTEGRGKWVDVSQNPITGVITTSNSYVRRTPWFFQTDLNLKHEYKITGAQSVAFDATFSNLLNEHAVMAYNEQIDSLASPSFIAPGGVPFYYGGVAYSAYEHPYDWKSLMNTDGVTVSSQYGKPYLWQSARNVRLGIHYNF